MLRRSTGTTAKPPLLELALLIVLSLGGSVSGDVRVMSGGVGWNDLVKPGHFHPATISVLSDDRHEATLRWTVPQPNRTLLVVEQSAVINPGRQSFIATLPIDDDAWAISLDIVDAMSGELLAHWPTTPRSPATEGALVLETEGPTAMPLVVVVGDAVDLPTEPTRVMVEELPRVSVAYDAVDVLVLANVELSHVSPEQQQAVVDWVDGGGMVWWWCDLLPLPGNSPLTRMLDDVLPQWPTRRDVDADGMGRWVVGSDDTPWTSGDFGEGTVVFFHSRPSNFPPVDARPTASMPRVQVETTRTWWIALLPIAILLGPIDWLFVRLQGDQRVLAKALPLAATLGLIMMLTSLLTMKEPVAPAPTWAGITVESGLANWNAVEVLHTIDGYSAK
jgi:hypothetical protein